MKKTLLILLSLIMCLSVFSACNSGTDNSSDVSVLSENESSINDSEGSVTSSVSGDSSESNESENPYISNLPYDYVIPEFDETKVIYNPNDFHKGGRNDCNSLRPNFGVKFDKDKFAISEYFMHEGLREYILNNEIPDDAWFPVCIMHGMVKTADTYDAQFYTDAYPFEGLPELLERIGFLEDEELAEKLTKLDSVKRQGAKIGYINMDMLWKIRRDGYSNVIEVIWIPEKCEECGFDAT